MQGTDWRKIFTRIWIDEKARDLSWLDKLVLHYLLSSPQTGRIGLFYCSPATAAEQIGVNADLCLKRIRYVCELCAWEYDEHARVVYIPTWWKYNGNIGPKRLLGYLKDIHQVPQTPWIATFLSNAKYLTKAESQALEKFANTYGVGMAIPTKYPCSDSATETETETEDNPPYPPSPPGGGELGGRGVRRRRAAPTVNPQQYALGYAARVQEQLATREHNAWLRAHPDGEPAAAPDPVATVEIV